MAVVVESVSTAAMADSATISINKPSGLSVDDLMVAVVAGNDGASPIATPSGWTSLLSDSTTVNGFARYRVAFKVADSSDVAASNFTFTNGDGGVIYRLSGYADTSFISTGTGTPASSDNHLILLNITGDNDGDTATFSGYSVTGGTSVSFTERYDDANTSGIRVSLGVADGQYASASAITAFSVTATGAVDDDNDFLIVIPASVSVTGTHALLSQSPTFSDPTATAGVVGTHSLHSVSPTFNAPAASGGQKLWSNETKPSTTWTNETRP